MPTHDRAPNVKAAICLALIAGNAYGSVCAKIEYAEARDWPAEQLERASCTDLDAMSKNLRDGMAQRSAEAKNAVLSASDACVENLNLFERVLQNIHKRPRPNCKK